MFFAGPTVSLIQLPKGMAQRSRQYLDGMDQMTAGWRKIMNLSEYILSLGLSPEHLFSQECDDEMEEFEDED